ncbi:DMT family transporter [Jonesia denitrificans]|uniref:Small multidrug resistance protein n=1 Tax=Jonesia denitrificans (strain ATCC 14870 / DSM 20603 / BCRC 15368 / CIP 55.134 / JCM 11481 / NBRC 15587 / NCTC 10816 / Prevot 55134) TaxID=471856 RepID=C7R3X3_JONDD|nr:multidrug efflux SMR transporter [Jonesia denitrificans]ACV08830.1 small multidrug resistance protein [Jonesia denitrificans DSM 20603]ASE09850.1 QacE family quaternary ammonium compound efflux SMR transporter [Jonesia denitrificans]QXB44385.1 multidrug efflux SMR transporter [Jonesia denitrificans]SQH20819.1 Quaternary ammonium compound-resistance protein sugE [Jonesia denitrificans]
MHWIILVISGTLEALWATALADSDGLRHRRATLVFIVSVLASTAGLAYAMTAIPTGTAYAIWVGIGTVLTVVVAVIRRSETLTWVRALLLLGIVAGVVGLKVASS